MIAREGVLLIIVGLAATAVVLLAAVRWDSKVILVFAAVIALLTVFTVFFFRDPDRTFEYQPGILVAPADGKVLSVETIQHHDFIGGEALKVSIFLSVFDVHVNRIPADGVVEFVRYNPGKFLPAFRDKASELNEQTEIGFTTTDGYRIVVKQIAGIIARRIVCRLKAHDTVKTGDRFGMIRFGSRTELFIPVGSRLVVAKGDYVKGSETVLGFLPEQGGEVEEAESAKEENVQL